MPIVTLIALYVVEPMRCERIEQRNVEPEARRLFYRQRLAQDGAVGSQPIVPSGHGSKTDASTWRCWIN